MLKLLIRYTANILCCTYTYNKLLNEQPKQNSIKLCLFLIIPVTTLLSYLLPASLQYLILPFSLLFTFFIFCFSTKEKPEIVFTTLVLSHSISYFYFCLAFFLLSILLAPIALYFFQNKNINENILQLLTACIQLFLSVLPFRIKRLKKGMPFLKKTVFSIIGVFIGSLILFCSMVMSFKNTYLIKISNKFYLILIPFIFILTLFIFMWWRNQIQQSYLLRLREQDYKRLEEQFKLCQEKLSDLEKENQALSKLIHRDNKLIPSMQLALHQLLEMEIKESTSKKRLKECNSLLVQLEQEMQDRNGIIIKLSCSNKKLESSGISSIDYLLTYMQQKSLNENIVFKVVFKKDVSKMLQDVITETNCVTILADLLENALIAIKSTCKAGHILLEMGKGKTFYEIHVWDDGIPFTKEVLYYLGKKCYTTHKKEGGSGIGMLNTYSLLQNYHASLIIDERPDIHPIYSKKITIRFDQKQQYHLLTHRAQEDILYLNKRNDLIIQKK